MGSTVTSTSPAISLSRGSHPQNGLAAQKVRWFRKIPLISGTLHVGESRLGYVTGYEAITARRAVRIGEERWGSVLRLTKVVLPQVSEHGGVGLTEGGFLDFLSGTAGDGGISGNNAIFGRGSGARRTSTGARP